jgi:hypothetical protein
MFNPPENEENPQIIDLRENKIEHNGFPGLKVWESIYASA